MSYTIKVQISEIGALQVVGKNNTNKREFVGVEVSEREQKYENILKFSLFKNAVSKIDQFKVGDVVEVSFDVKGHKWTDRIFIELNAWKIELVATASDTDEVNELPREIPPSTTGDDLDNLPF
jgi:hypothetical protein